MTGSIRKTNRNNIKTEKTTKIQKIMWFFMYCYVILLGRYQNTTDFLGGRTYAETVL